MILANKSDWFRTISLAKQSEYGGGYHPLAIIRNDSAMKRSLGPTKVKLTQGSYWDLKVICSELTCLLQVQPLFKNPSKQSEVIQIATLQVMCISSKKPAPHGTCHGSNTHGRKMWVKGWLNIEEVAKECKIARLLHSCVPLARQWSSVSYYMLSA